ncbi:MAG: YeeE/YedE thiosulfate transporter family protein [Syntrophaceae bacterium]|nr:YeeE/YedE thiosulfate transporter family protein [Syntrophaceae bacterium]
MGPLLYTGAISYETGLWLAFPIGLMFGFILEKAGFGDSRNLTNIFYFRDMRVLRVMFSALVTAMLGLIALSYAGLFDYNILVEDSLMKSYFWPQLVGGVVFGLGFVIGGYCPGTAIVGVASGKIDSIVFLIGMVFGIWVFAFGWPIWGNFYMSSDLGRITLWQFFGTSKDLMALIILVMALFAFVLARLGEKWGPYNE